MTRQKTFLIRAELGRSGVLKECVMRLPVDQNGGITNKGRQAIRSRFFDGSTQTPGSMQYALNLEAFSNGHDITAAIKKYYENKV